MILRHSAVAWTPLVDNLGLTAISKPSDGDAAALDSRFHYGSISIVGLCNSQSGSAPSDDVIKSIYIAARTGSPLGSSHFEDHINLKK